MTKKDKLRLKQIPNIFKQIVESAFMSGAMAGEAVEQELCIAGNEKFLKREIDKTILMLDTKYGERQ